MSLEILLQTWGWPPDQALPTLDAQAGESLGRVIADRGSHLTVESSEGRVRAHLPPGDERSLRRPVVGDWVILRPSEGDLHWVHATLPRWTWLRRRLSSRPDAPHVLAANVDTVAVVMSLNRDLNERRLARYLVAVHEGGAAPLVLLTKADLVDAPEAVMAPLRAAHPAVPMHCLSALQGEGLAPLREHLVPGKTLALVGSSGVGKSTLINALLAEARMATASIRERDDRGRHTTTHRELFLLPDRGGLIMDTPGLREFAPWDAVDNLGETFPEIEALAGTCQFRDCKHENDPGCAVREALESGVLDAARVDSWRRVAANKERSAVPRRAPASRPPRKGR